MSAAEPRSPCPRGYCMHTGNNGSAAARYCVWKCAPRRPTDRLAATAARSAVPAQHRRQDVFVPYLHGMSTVSSAWSSPPASSWAIRGAGLIYGGMTLLTTAAMPCTLRPFRWESGVAGCTSSVSSVGRGTHGGRGAAPKPRRGARGYGMGRREASGTAARQLRCRTRPAPKVSPRVRRGAGRLVGRDDCPVPATCRDVLTDHKFVRASVGLVGRTRTTLTVRPAGGELLYIS